MSEGKPTAGPWHTNLDDFGMLPTNGYLAIYGGDSSCIAHALTNKQHWERGEREHPVRANAAFIVRACNAHDDLVAALQMVCHDVRSGAFPTDVQNVILAAIAKAGAQP